MTGVLFLVIIPKTDYEKELRKGIKTKYLIEGEKLEKTNKIIEELRIHKKFCSSKSNIEAVVEDKSVKLSKCKSTDCINSTEKENVIQKSNSEQLTGTNEKRTLEGESKNYIRETWDDIKQMIKCRKQKLEITTCKGENDYHASLHYETSLEMILTEILKRLLIKSAAWTSDKDGNIWQVTFPLRSGHLIEEVLQILKAYGIGSRYQSSLSVIPLALYYNSNNEIRSNIDELKLDEELSDSSWSRFASSVKARTNLAQVLNEVRSDAAFTFDWLFLLVVAAFVAAIGLVENSTVILVASMLISPLMAPITAGTLGTALKDRPLQRMGVQHELFGLFLALLIGFIFGLTICAIDEHYGVGDWPTKVMLDRCEIRSLWVGVLVAIPSGAGVALAVLGDYAASLVGVAISASLLPPAVNAGLLWAMSLVHYIFMEDQTRWTGVLTTSFFSKNQALELAALGAISLCLTLVNIICIFFAGIAVYKVKKVSPIEPPDLKLWGPRRESQMYFRSNFNWKKREHLDDFNLDFYRYPNSNNNTTIFDIEPSDHNTKIDANAKRRCDNSRENEHENTKYEVMTGNDNNRKHTILEFNNTERNDSSINSINSLEDERVFNSILSVYEKRPTLNGYNNIINSHNRPILKSTSYDV